MRKFLLPLLFMLLFIAESIFVEFVPEKIMGEPYIIAPRFLIVALIFLTIYGPRKYGLLYSFIAGLLFDIVYTEIVGIYLFLFPVVCYIISKLMKILQSNIVIVSLVALFGVLLLELGVYEMYFLIHLTNMHFSTFLSLRLLPTLIFNFIFIVITAYPLKKHYDKLVASLDI
ncbi:rod shape-determining protein MreD [Bacillus sp. S/N-304-OC-R1]|uniref:rod shape-determining protein MreD n=1 Tax=Bacillus sp. S/N-304-OC-R1 TaxID=2758034 RepID=UPI001C8EED0A|nr:rod shape-determining protein MreD [Bacillus sp. S/N-304-OC-R1]MBY0123953.1 rod shape-determining protein MreD [Bacillus sp. S/N-304-OC-R1]